MGAPACKLLASFSEERESLMGLIMQSVEFTYAAHSFTHGSQFLSLSQWPISPQTDQMCWSSMFGRLNRVFRYNISGQHNSKCCYWGCEQPLVHPPTKSFSLPSVCSNRGDPYSPQKKFLWNNSGSISELNNNFMAGRSQSNYRWPQASTSISTRDIS